MVLPDRLFEPKREDDKSIQWYYPCTALAAPELTIWANLPDSMNTVIMPEEYLNPYITQLQITIKNEIDYGIKMK